MEKTRTFETILFVLFFVYNGNQECAAHPDKTTSSTMEEDYSEEPAEPNEAALIKSKAIYDALPDDLRPYNEQVAVRGLGPDNIGLLYDGSGNVYKPNPRDTEIEFLEKLYASTDPIVQELKTFAPKYFGIRMIKIGDREIRFLHMENITKGFEIPCNIKVKIKHMIWDPPSDDRSLRYKEMTDAYGFGITGFKYFDVMTGENVRNEREFAFHMKPHEGIRTLYKFVNGEIGIRCGVVKKIVEQLEKIHAWFARQHHFIIDNNSVLLTYDAKDLVAYVKRVKKLAESGNSMNKDCSDFDVPVRVRMVFFGKVTEIRYDYERDRKYLKALTALIPIMENITRLNKETYYDPLLSQIQP